MRRGTTIEVLTRRLLTLCCSVLLLWGIAASQTPRPARPLDSLKADFTKASAVAYVRVKSYTIDDDLGGLYLYKVKANVEEAFKGDTKKGRTIEYYVRLPYADRLTKDTQIVFLRTITREEEPAFLESRTIRGDLVEEALAMLRELAPPSQK